MFDLRISEDLVNRIDFSSWDTGFIEKVDPGGTVPFLGSAIDF